MNTTSERHAAASDTAKLVWRFRTLAQEDGRYGGIDNFNAMDSAEHDLIERITTLESALAECRRDAERYRWLKTRHDVMSGDKTATVIFWNDHGPYEPPSGFSLDNAIDAAIARSETND